MRIRHTWTFAYWMTWLLGCGGGPNGGPADADGPDADVRDAAPPGDGPSRPIADRPQGSAVDARRPGPLPADAVSGAADAVARASDARRPDPPPDVDADGPDLGRADAGGPDLEPAEPRSVDVGHPAAGPSDADAREAPPRPDLAALRWACPPLDCKRDVPDAPEGSPMMCQGLDVDLDCRLPTPVCQVVHFCEYDGGLTVGSPEEGLEECSGINGGSSGWCRYDGRGQLVEQQGDEFTYPAAGFYVYDGQGRLVSSSEVEIEGNRSRHIWGGTCSYDESGRVTHVSRLHIEEDDAMFTDGSEECVRYDENGRVIGRELVSFVPARLWAHRDLASAEADTCAFHDEPAEVLTSAACREALEAVFPTF